MEFYPFTSDRKILIHLNLYRSRLLCSYLCKKKLRYARQWILHSPQVLCWPQALLLPYTSFLLEPLPD